MNQSIFKRVLMILAVIGLAVYHLYPPNEKITLGIDLKGGTAYTVKLDLSKTDVLRRKGAVDKAVEILRKRLDRYGLSEPIIQPAGEDRILIQIPGLSADRKAEARAQMERMAYLEFRRVHPDNEAELARMRREGGLPPVGYEALPMLEERKNQPARETEILVKVRPELTGKYLVKAVTERDPGGIVVGFTLNREGGEIFRKFTGEAVREYPAEEQRDKRRLAIILDRKCISAPSINSEIGERGQISGNFTLEEADNLANVLENPLETPVSILEERSVEPSLGSDSIRSGAMAGIVGLALVVVFMAIYYLRAGLIANVALLINVILIFGVLAIFKFTLTLPGIAGIILTVGIAVDANVLIYERIREELRKNKPLTAAIEAGFERATTTIIDANVTTLITSLVLLWLGTGPVQGFGYTLSVGIVTSVFCAVVVSRVFFDILTRYAHLEKLTMLSIVKDTRINFLAFEWPALALSAAIILAGLFICAKRGSEIYGVDFTGGDAITLNFSKREDVSSVRKALEATGLKDLFIQYQRTTQGSQEILLIKVPYNMGEKAVASLESAFPQAGFKQAQMDRVGATVGGELRWTAAKGLLVASIGILLYVTARFEFGYAVGVVVALIHDLLICLAAYFLTGRQLSLPAMGALLTIAGYSLNDKIVVFDRLRENVKLKGEKNAFADLINLSINEVLSRTLLTSLTTMIAALSLYFLGGGVINDFAFILAVGVLTGTYSSVFIANRILLLWHPSKLTPQKEETTGIGAQKPSA